MRRPGWLDLFQATGEVRWLIAATDLIDTALERFAAGDGGFHDTADDAEQLVTARDASDNASPSGLSSLIHALVTAAAITGERATGRGGRRVASVHALVTNHRSRCGSGRGRLQEAQPRSQSYDRRAPAGPPSHQVRLQGTGGWITDMFAATTFPRVRAVCWFQGNKERDWRVNSSNDALKATLAPTPPT